MFYVLHLQPVSNCRNHCQEQVRFADALRNFVGLTSIDLVFMSKQTSLLDYMSNGKLLTNFRTLDRWDTL